jgi:hypothetical protein
LTVITAIVRASLLALIATSSTAGVAAAGTAFDGRWSLTISTARGPCDPSYNFPVQISNGAVSFPGLVNANGRVANNGAVRVFVSAMGKSANGSGQLTLGSGKGRWSGQSGTDKCSGTWTAERS